MKPIHLWRGYFLIVIAGLVLAWSLASLAAYLVGILVSVLVEMLRDSGSAGWEMFVMAPLYMAASVMPFWLGWIYCRMLVVSDDAEDLMDLRRAAWRMLRWSMIIYIALAAAAVLLAWPEIRSDTIAVLAALGFAWLLVIAPLLLLLFTASPIGPDVIFELDDE